VLWGMPSKLSRCGSRPRDTPGRQAQVNLLGMPAIRSLARPMPTVPPKKDKRNTPPWGGGSPSIFSSNSRHAIRSRHTLLSSRSRRDESDESDESDEEKSDKHQPSI
jgi:hypothetical protein